MSLEELLQQFDVLADAPSGVQRLRELVLQLAVRGKLVPQDSNDEPASVLLERIAAEKDRLYAEGKIGKPRVGEAVLPCEDVPYAVPDTWCWVRLSSVGEIVGGGTPKTDVAAYWTDADGVPWLTPADLNGLRSKYVQQGRRQISQWGLENSSAQLLPAGAVLFSSRAPIGYVAIAANPLATNQGFKSCVPYLDGMSEYIFRYLQAVAPEVDRQAPGTTFKEVSGRIVGQIPFALPPLPEQRRIVAKVDELMALCDQLEARQQRRTVTRARLNRSVLHHLTNASDDVDLAAHWQRLREQFELLYDAPEMMPELRQAVLQLAIRGKLVPQDPRDEPASVLLERIAAERQRLIAERKVSKPKPLVPISHAEAPFAVPEGWTWCRLGQAILTLGDGPHYSPTYVPKDSGVPFLSTRNVRVDGFDLSDVKYVSEKDHREFTKKIKAEAGDVLYTKGGTTGIAKVNDLPFDFSVWVHVAVLKIPKGELDPQYLALALNSPHCFAQSQQYTQGSSNSDLGLTRMINITVPLPPLAEQHRIAAKVAEFMALCDALETQLTQTRAKSAHLIASVVHYLTAA